MPYKAYWATSLTGGTTGCLDKIPGADLADKDIALVILSTGDVYEYWLDDDSAASESSPDIIAPDSGGGDKRWLLKSINNQDVSSDATVTFGTVNALTLAAQSVGFTIAGGTTSKTLTLSETLTLDGASGKTLTLEENLTIVDGQDIDLHASGGEKAQLAIDTQNAERTLDMSADLTVEATSVINSDLSTDANWATSGTLGCGALTVNSGTGQSIIIKGTSTGDSNLGWIGFYDSNGTTRRGWVGDSSNQNDDIVLGADTGDLKLRAAGEIIVDGNLALAANSITGTSVDISNAELQQLSNIGNTTISANQWAALGGIAETLTGAELNILDGVTGVTAAELSYIGDVTGLIQNQIDAKAALAGPTFSGTVTVPSTNFTIGSTTFSETQLSEVTTFFDSTNISAAEAETLTDGSDADALHAHDTYALESVLGTSIGTGLLLSATVLKVSAILQRYHSIDPAANVQSFLGAADYAAMMVLLSGTATGAFSFNSQNLTSVGTIACGAITTSGNFLVSKATPTATITDTSVADVANDIDLDFKLNSDSQSRIFGRITTISSTITDASRTGTMRFAVANDGAFAARLEIIGKDVDIKAHDAATVGLKLGGTLVTSSAAQINVLAGLVSWTIDGGNDGEFLATNGAGTLTWAVPAGGNGGVTDHGALTGLDDHDHSNIYYSETEIDTWRSNVSQAEMGRLDGISANGGSLIGAADYAAMMVLLSGEAGAAFSFNSQNLTSVGTIGCGNIIIAGNSPLILDGVDNSAVTKKGGAGGWTFGFHAMGSGNTVRGGFGFLGEDDALTNYYIGTAFDDACVLAYAAGDVDIAKHNAATVGLKLGGTLVTASAAEINALDGISANGTSFIQAANYAAMMALLTGEAGAAFSWNSQNLTSVGDIGAGTSELTIGSINRGADDLLFEVAGNLGAAISGDETIGDEAQFGGTGTYLFASDHHATGANAMVVNVCYGVGAAPTASNTPIGSIYIKYVA